MPCQKVVLSPLQLPNNQAKATSWCGLLILFYAPACNWKMWIKHDHTTIWNHFDTYHEILLEH